MEIAKLNLLILSTACFSTLFAQTYTETFDLDGKGVFSDEPNPARTEFSGVNWRITGDFSGLDGTDSFATSGGILTAVDTDQLLTWHSGTFSTQGTTQFQISLDALANGDFENTDALSLTYSLDGAAAVTIADGIFVENSGNGSFNIAGTQLNGSFQNVATNFSTLAGAELEIFISVRNNSNSESFSFDNIVVTAVPEASSYALLAGILSLISLSLRRR